MEDDHCASDKKCILNKCETPSNYCDESGKCPDGRKNYWGKCIKTPYNCTKHSECPKMMGCNTRDGICYMISCWNKKQCKRTFNVEASPRRLPDCYRPNSIGLGFCYK